MSTTPANTDHDDGHLIVRTEEEWCAAANRSLQNLGLTFDELARQAKDDNFESIDAMKLWRVLGGERP